MNKDARPYLVNRRCGHCIIPLETTERHAGGWLFVTYACLKCGFKQVISFSPAELMEWDRRGSRARAVANSMI
ncbi:MAG: hypothetical protein MUP19_06745 [Candidatus Aminicenantes bacterium]|nr:hypothetical protein [Candidatus Aminicenantes bacterium]